MKMLRWLILPLLALPGAVFAQTLVNCAPATPCTVSGPSNTGTGDQAWLAFGKVNADLIAMQAQLSAAITALGTVTTGVWHATPVGGAYGGSGEAGTITGVLYGNGASAYTAATSANIAAPWTGCSGGSPYMEYTGACGAGGGGGGSPGGSAYSTQYQTSGGAFGGTGPGTTGYVLTSNGPTAVPTFQPVSGGGTITVTGTTPTSGKAVLWTGATSLGAYTPSGDCTIDGSFAIICQFMNGHAVTLGGALITSGAVTINQASTFTSNTGNIGTLEVQQDLVSGNHTFLNTDNGEHLKHTGSGAAAWTGPTNSVDLLPIGALVTVVNETGGGPITITPADTMIISGTGSTVCPSGCAATTMSVAAAGVMTMLKTGSTEWFVGSSGSSGVSSGAGTVLMQGAIPFILSSSGSVGNNCAVSGLTAMQTTYANAYIWMESGAIYVGSTAGWYYYVASGTTAGTCYNNVYTSGQPTIPASPTAFSTTGPGAFTQATAAQIVGPTVSVAANTMGVNGDLAFDGGATVPATANAKQVFYEFGGTPAGIADYASTAVTSFGWAQHLRNRGVANAQVSTGFNVGEPSAGNSGPNFLSINTVSAQNFSYNLQIATATDYIVLESYSVKEYAH